MVKCMCGTGRPRNCTTSSRHMMMCVSVYCGTLMKPPKWPRVDGMESSSTGIEGQLCGRRLGWDGVSVYYCEILFGILTWKRAALNIKGRKAAI